MAKKDDSEVEATKQEPEMPKLTRVAYEVIQGGWSQGKYRQKLLIDAGHNPYEVEEEVKRLQDEKKRLQDEQKK